MCSNYLPVTRADRLLTFFGVERGAQEAPVEAWPTGLAPFIRLADPASGNKRIVENGHFGLVGITDAVPGVCRQCAQK